MLEMIQNKKKEAGFTLIELLIVVAIIAILIAISIPIMGGITENAAKQTDAANLRSAKAEVLIDSLGAGANSGISGGVKDGEWYCYDAANGKLSETAPGTSYAKMSSHKDMFIWVMIGADDKVTAGWSATKPSGTVTSGAEEVLTSTTTTPEN